MIFSLRCRVERLDGCGIEDTVVSILVEEIAMLRIDAIRYGDWGNGEIVMRSGHKTTLTARWADWEELRKALHERQ
jgi:hypothetical protein